MSLSTVLSRDIVATRLIFNMIKRNKYEDYLKDTCVGDLKWSAITDNSLSVRGWLKCDGTSLSRTTYSELFAVIGTTHGSVDATQFNLPNCNGRVLAAPGQPTNGAGSSNYALGTAYGNQKHTLIIDEMPAHTHGGQTDQSVDRPNTETVTSVLGTAGVSGETASPLTFTTNPTGGSQAFDIQQPTLVVGHVFIYSGIKEPLEPNVDTVGPDDTEYSA